MDSSKFNNLDKHKYFLEKQTLTLNIKCKFENSFTEIF